MESIRKTRNNFIKWVPFIVSIIFSIVTAVIYASTVEKITLVPCLQLIVVPFISAIVPVIEMITKKSYPLFINIMITTHAILASYLGSVLSFYGRFASWDLVMHGYFGFIAGVVFYIILLKWNGQCLNKFGFYTLIVLSTLGTAALWEVWEYSSDIVFDGDAQKVKEALLAGKNPMTDTITDILIAVVGVALFFICIYIDKKLGGNFKKTLSFLQNDENR